MCIFLLETNLAISSVLNLVHSSSIAKGSTEVNSKSDAVAVMETNSLMYSSPVS